ncbi:MAG TPA: kelch repeat-containing protein, partial [Pseudomonadota bacterium]|nr:kelch repeat-containing protein [Pseudomonadota bacterium]
GRYEHSAGPAPGGSALVAFGDSPAGLRQDSFGLDLASGQFVPQLGTAPAPRAEAAMAYDEERDEVLLFGGRGATAPLGDTWSFTPAAGWRAQK